MASTSSGDQRAAVGFDDVQVASADDHLQAMDALYRFGAGVDHGDARLLASAFSDDAVIDFTPCGRALGLDFPLMKGSSMIVGFLGATAATQVTTHVVTNGRVQVDGNATRLCALVDATHFARDDQAQRLEMVNWYEAELVRTESPWRIRRLVIKNVWFAGDPQVLLRRENMIDSA